MTREFDRLDLGAICEAVGFPAFVAAGDFAMNFGIVGFPMLVEELSQTDSRSEIALLPEYNFCRSAITLAVQSVTLVAQSSSGDRQLTRYGGYSRTQRRRATGSAGDRNRS
jgi:hypothetical protein